MKILFICTGNTCRSGMAEAIARKMAQDTGLVDVKFSSAGLAACPGMSASRQAIEVMRNNQIDLALHKARSLTGDMVKEADLILTMTKGHKDNISYNLPLFANKVFTLEEFAFANNHDIEDPYGQSVEIYQKVSEELTTAIKQVFNKIKNKKI